MCCYCWMESILCYTRRILMGTVKYPWFVEVEPPWKRDGAACLASSVIQSCLSSES